MISKELLSLVLDEDLQVLAELNNASLIIETDKDNNKLEVYLKFSFDETEDSLLKEINLDTLGRLCKEWCLEQGFIMNVQTSDINCMIYIGATDTDIQAKTEIEAIVEATEYIAKEKGLL